MRGYNCIMVFSPDGRKLLFCKRTKEPYRGLYNLVGGKIENDENGLEAAYRELKEETGICSNRIQLNHMMDFTYYNQNHYVIEIYVGQLNGEIELHEEINPLEWLSVDENYFDCSKFAGEGNIGHMVKQARIYRDRQDELLFNLDRLHTTELGMERIGKNLNLDVTDIAAWCKEKIENANNIIKKGKNWYVYADNIVFTINALSFTIITAHRDNRKTT
jgi:8-oxo-dGTP diphosphatase